MHAVTRRRRRSFASLTMHFCLTRERLRFVVHQYGEQQKDTIPTLKMKLIDDFHAAE